MDINEKIGLIKEVGEEILTVKELEELFKKKKNPIAYDGFEPSGKLHIAQGIQRTINVNKMIKAGVHFKMWVADWFAWMNNKMDGDLEKIRAVGEYQIETWKACGMETGKIEFLWANDVMKDAEYWKKVIEIGRNNTVTRVVRCSQIMGRSEKDALSAAQIFYPCMQCADIFHLKADITQLGMDQRKVNVLAREVAPKLGYDKPVVVSHHMLMGLTEPKKGLEGAEAAIEKKMSKSKPNTAIFMNDSKEEIEAKINKAYCPQGISKDNPILEYCKYLVFEVFDTLVIERPEKWGGKVTFNNYVELEKYYTSDKLHPGDLKKAVAKKVDEMVGPVRQHFQKVESARKLLQRVESYTKN